MSNQGWQTVSYNKKDKQSESSKPVKFDPIPSRQYEAQIKLEQDKQDKQVNNQIKLNESQSNVNQDWKYITISKPQQKPKTIYTQREPTSIKTNESGEIVQVKKVSSEMAKKIIDARVAKKWSQIQFAHNSAVDVKTIAEIERGGCIYNANIFNKLCKTLGITIERNYILEKKLE